MLEISENVCLFVCFFSGLVVIPEVLGYNTVIPGKEKESMDQETSKNVPRIVGFVIGGLVCAAFIICLIVLGLDNGTANTASESGTSTEEKTVRYGETFVSDRYGYSLKFNGSYVQENILMDSASGATMERFYVAGEELNSYISVVSIDDSVDLDETLEAFSEDEDDSYDFSFTKDTATFGAENYEAIHIYYEDTNGDTAIDVNYYYMEDAGLLVTAASDKNYADAISGLLATFTLVK